jgi:hypothetical protein
VCVCVCVCAYFGGTSAHVSIRTSACVSRRGSTRTSCSCAVCVCVCIFRRYVSTRQRTYVSMRQQRQYAHLLLLRRRVLAYASGLERVLVARRLVKRHSGGGGSVCAAYVSIRQHTSAYTYYSTSSVRILKAHRALTNAHTSAYVSTRQHTRTEHSPTSGLLQVRLARALSLSLCLPQRAPRGARE